MQEKKNTPKNIVRERDTFLWGKIMQRMEKRMTNL